MPLYAFRCPACSRYVEYYLPVADRDAPISCDCGETIRRIYTPPLFNLNGNGAGQMSDPITAYQFKHLDDKAWGAGREV